MNIFCNNLYNIFNEYALLKCCIFNAEPVTYSRTDGASQDAGLLSEGLLAGEPLHQATWEEGRVIYTRVRRKLTHGGDTLVTGGDGGGRGRGQQAGEGQEELHSGLSRLKSGQAKPAGSFIHTFYLLLHVTQ